LRRTLAGVAAAAAIAIAITAALANGAFGAPGAGTITTIAGTGRAGFSGDGGPAASAQLAGPNAVAVDGRGNIYIADRENHRVRRVSAAGTITTIAGTGTSGFSGDGGPAAAARLYVPSGVAVDGRGNVYIADLGNNRVRRVSSSGTITTIAAQLAGPGGGAVDGRGNFYFTEGNRVRKVTPGGTITTVAGTGVRGFSGDGGRATSARLDGPEGVAVDRLGAVYISDYGNGRVRKVSPGGTITTIAGTGRVGFSGDGGPATSARMGVLEGVAVDNQRNVYIADDYSQRVRRIGRDGTITSIAGTGRAGFSGDGGPATSARLKDPFGLAVDERGNVYIAEYSNNRVRKIRHPAVATPTSAVAIRRFVDRIENVLALSAAGRRELGGALAAGFDCSIPRSTAAQRVERVVDNRRRVLRHLETLNAPSRQAGAALGLLRLAIRHSMEADIHYRDGFALASTSHCPVATNSSFRLAKKSDLLASTAKQRFIAAFNVLARRANRRAWSASEI